MTALNKPPRYQTYLLRCWQERSQQSELVVVWRFSLENPHTGKRRGFASLEALLASLQTELDDDDESSNTISEDPI